MSSAKRKDAQKREETPRSSLRTSRSFASLRLIRPLYFWRLRAPRFARLFLRLVDRDKTRTAVSPDQHEHAGPFDFFAQLHRLFRVGDRLFVELQNDVAFPQSLFRGRAVGID